MDFLLTRVVRPFSTVRSMKAGLATSLSIIGVLVTGGAALALNSSILDTETSAKGTPAFATVVGLEKESGVMPLGDGAAPRSAAKLSASGIVDVINGDQNPSATPPAASAPSTATASETPAPVATVVTPSTSVPIVEKQFKVGDAATITLVVDGTKLRVKDIAITPGTDYRVTNQTSRDGDDVRITLSSPMRAIDFSARLVNGQIMAAVSEPSSGNLNSPRPHDDDEHDDGDDEHHEREHKDDDEHDEHHEREHDDDD